MLYRMYALYSKDTRLYEGIMLYRSDAVACRGFEAMLQNSNGKFSASDFVLYCLGTFDNETADMRFYGESMVEVPFVPRYVPEEEKMSSDRNETSLL